MSEKHYATFMSHDGVLLVELDQYNDRVRSILENIHPHYDLGGVIKGGFVDHTDLGSHLLTMKEFLKDVVEEAKRDNRLDEVERAIGYLYNRMN